MANSEFKLDPLDRKRSDRRKLRRSLWADARWWIIGALFLAALVLGYVGFGDYQAAVGGPDGVLDILYLDLQLFVIESGALEVASAIPVSLQVARLLAPLAVVLLAQRALAPLFRDQLQILRSWSRSGHTVVCGLGHRGLEVARSLHERGERVVAIEQDGNNDHVRACRAAAVPVVIGDATDDAVLRKAGTGRAARLVALCRDDAVNAKIATGARALAAEANRTEPLDCLAHIYEPQLCSLLQTSESTRRDGSPMRLDFFNTFESGAQVLLLRHPPFPDRGSPGQPHLLVVGLGWLGSSLVVQAARSWQLTHWGAHGKLDVTVVDLKADSEVESLQARHPLLKEICQIVPKTLGVRDGSFANGDFRSPDRPITRAYVCLDDDVLSLEAALVLNRLLGPHVPVVMRALTEGGLPALLQGRADDEFGKLEAFPLINRICDPDLLFGGEVEVIARKLHDRYLGAKLADGWTYAPARDDEAKTNPAVTEWDDLDESFRRSNRHQAGQIMALLERIHCRREAADAWEIPLSFTDDEVEILAEMEHGRYVEEKKREGFTLGPGDLALKQNPSLIPWDDLSEQMRDFDREPVRELPVILARLGYRIVREKPAGAPT